MIEIPKSFDRASALVNAWLIAAPSRARGGLRSRDIRTASLLTTVSVSGKRDSEGQRQLAQNRLQAGKGLHGDRNADVGARQLRAFWKSQGNLAVRKSAWWGWKDSNVRTDGYERTSPLHGKRIFPVTKSDLFPWAVAPAYLVRDNDRALWMPSGPG